MLHFAVLSLRVAGPPQRGANRGVAVNFEIKLIAALAIAAVAVVGGRLALRISASTRGAWYLTLGNALAGGVFLGAALIHLLGDAQAHMAAVVQSEVRWVAMLVGLGFLLVMLPERVVFAGRSGRTKPRSPPRRHRSLSFCSPSCSRSTR